MCCGPPSEEMEGSIALLAFFLYHQQARGVGASQGRPQCSLQSGPESKAHPRRPSSLPPPTPKQHYPHPALPNLPPGPQRGKQTGLQCDKLQNVLLCKGINKLFLHTSSSVSKIKNVTATMQIYYHNKCEKYSF